jgi:hypothetical protein
VVSLDGLMIHDVTRAATVVDRYGNWTKDWDAASRNEVKGWVSQVSRSEVLDGREAQVSGWVCYLPAGTDVTGLDRVEWEDATFEVDGPILPAWSPVPLAAQRPRIGGVHHLELALKAVTG